MQKDSDQSCLLKKCKYRPTISYQNSFSKRSTHQSITCWFWYLLFLFIFFVDLFKPLLQKTFVEGIVENPLRDQSWSFSSPWLKESKARKGIWTQGNLVAPRCISQNWPEALQLTFDLSTFSALWSTDLKKGRFKKASQSRWLQTKFNVTIHLMSQFPFGDWRWMFEQV